MLSLAYRCEPTAQAHAPIRAISNDNRPQLSAVASPLAGQHLCCAKIIVTAAIKGQDKLQLFSCLSKRQERERFFHGCNMFVTAAVHMLDLSPIWQAPAIRRALPIASSIVRRIRVAYALISMSKKRLADPMDSAIHISDVRSRPNGLFFVVNDRVRKLFPLRCGSV